MNIPNPFKKKEEKGFSLDDMELPNLNSFPNPQEQTPVGHPPDMSSNPFEDQVPQQVGSQNQFSSTPQSPERFGETTNNTSQQNQTPTNSNEIEMLQTKINSLDSKIALNNAKLSNIEEKLELIYSLIHSEVSEETKRKHELTSMMDQVRRE